MTHEALASLVAQAHQDLAITQAATAGPWEAIPEEMNANQFQVIDSETGCYIITTENNGCASDPCPDEVFFSREDAAFIAHAKAALEASAQAVLTLAARVAELERQLVDAKNRLNRELEVAKRHGM